MSQTVERAAGGLVVRRTQQGFDVLLIDDAYGHVAFPKGHLEAGETWEDAAVREILEETSVEARVLAPLGRVEYAIHRDGNPVRKQVRLFVLEVVDEKDVPVHQQEEVNGAYFLPWTEAEAAQRNNGYENWNWVFEKAKAILDWHDGNWERKWRGLQGSETTAALEQAYREVTPVVDKLLAAVHSELKTVASDIYEQLPEIEETQLPREVQDMRGALLDAIEHTLLKPEASAVDILKVCGEAKANRFKAVCVNPQHVPLVAESLHGTNVIACTVVGFPLGAADLSALAAETRTVIQSGATEVDMVIPIGAMKEDDIWTVYNHIRTVCQVAHQTPGVRVKVIFEVHFLTYEQVAKVSLLALAAGADFLKTSTGFAASGAKIADVALMATVAGDSYGVKAAGGIRTRTDAVHYLRFGANRIGTSSGVAIVRE